MSDDPLTASQPLPDPPSPAVERPLARSHGAPTDAIFRHCEAFRLMLYMGDDGETFETIWNSRDGVTPFIVRGRGGVELRHVSWQGDGFSLFHVPAIGERIFVDLSAARARIFSEKIVDGGWSDRTANGKTMAEAFNGDREKAIEHFVADMLERASPDLVEVDGPLQRAFYRKRIEALRTAEFELAAEQRGIRRGGGSA